MPPRFSKEVLQLRDTFNPKFIAKKMAPKTAAKPKEIASATAKPTVARKKTTAKRGGGRGRGGRSRNPPISLQLDAEVDIDTDEEDSGSKGTKENEDIEKSSDVVETSEKGNQSSEMKEGELEGEKSKEGNKEKESEEKSEKSKESEEKLEEKEKESKEKSKESEEKLEEKEKESEEKSKENEKKEMSDDEKDVVEKNDDDVLLKDLVSETLEKDKRSESDATEASTVEREIGSNAKKIDYEVVDVEDRDDTTMVFDDGLDPLFSKPASRTRSKRKMLEIFGDDDEDETPEASPPKSKVTQRKRGSGSKTKATKRARYHRDLPSIDENEIIEEKVPLNTCMDLVIAPFAESFKNDIFNHLNSLDLPEEIFKLCHGILICCFHSGRRYKKSWYDTSPAFKYFKEAMYAQGWVNLLDKYSPMYLSEVIQFYATVKVDVESGTLSAFINQKPFVLTIDQLAAHLDICDVGLTSFPKRDWGEIDEVTSNQVMKVLRPHDDDGPTNIYAFELTAPIRFIFNLVFRNLVPSNNSRGRCSLLDMLLIHHIVKHKPINLPRLMFHRILEMSTEFQNGNFDKNAVVPYGMWLSIIFMREGLVLKGSPAIEKLTDEMTPGLLSRMNLEIKNGKLERKNQSGSTVGSTVEMGVVLAKLDELLGIVNRLVKEQGKLRDEVGDLRTMNEDLLERLQNAS